MSYVLLGEFDIDEGSILKHQYPSLTGADEHLLAELMLPDGAHSRSEDWTIFYLNQTQAVMCTAESEEGKLLYVLNLVRTKKDDKVRRCVSRLLCCMSAKQAIARTEERWSRHWRYARLSRMFRSTRYGRAIDKHKLR